MLHGAIDTIKEAVMEPLLSLCCFIYLYGVALNSYFFDTTTIPLMLLFIGDNLKIQDDNYYFYLFLKSQLNKKKKN